MGQVATSTFPYYGMHSDLRHDEAAGIFHFTDIPPSRPPAEAEWSPPVPPPAAGQSWSLPLTADAVSAHLRMVWDWGSGSKPHVRLLGYKKVTFWQGCAKLGKNKVATHVGTLPDLNFPPGLKGKPK